MPTDRHETLARRLARARPDPWHRGRSLLLGTPFVWGRDRLGTLVVRDDPDGATLAAFTAAQHARALDLLTGSRDGTPVGVPADGRRRVDPLGHLVAGFGASRSAASWLAAVAVAEGFVDVEHRPGGGLWLVPATEAGAEPEAPLDSMSGRPGRGLGAGAAERLRTLADAVEATSPAEVRSWTRTLSHLAAGGIGGGAFREIAALERAAAGAACLYRIDADAARTAETCRVAFDAARERNVSNRRFVRANRARPGGTCLHVGVSRPIAERVRQHAGLAHGGVPALHLRHWVWPGPVAALEGELRLTVWRLPPDVDDDVARALADAERLRHGPLFGAPGGR